MPRRKRRSHNMSSQRSQPGSSGSAPASDEPVNMDVEFIKRCKLQCTENFIVTWGYCQNDENRQELKAQAEKTMLGLIKTELQLTEAPLLLENVEIPELNDDSETSHVLKEYEENCDEMRNKFVEGLDVAKLKKHRDYQELMKLINKKFKEVAPAAGANDTQDIFEDSVEDEAGAGGSGTGPAMELIPTVDPVSKGPLVDPVRNRVCLHVYGKVNILALLGSGKNKKIRCPQLGCQTFIQKSDLIEDPELADKVRQRVAQSQRYAAEKAKAKRDKHNTTAEVE